eukprot:6519904-Pyramimonas_sp.AAC.1
MREAPNIELLDLLDEDGLWFGGVQIFKKPSNTVWRSGCWVTDWVRSVLPVRCLVLVNGWQGNPPVAMWMGPE